MASIDNGIYDRVAATWWEQDGFMAVLRTSVNPPRFAWFRNALEQRLGLVPAGLQVLDAGCGGGLLAEQFAALGCAVTGIDQSVPTLEAARAHAQKSALSIRYLHGTAEHLPFDTASFDVVCCCDVLEHVDLVDTVIAELARVLKPGGVLLFDTINRTWRSKLVAIKIAQDWWPTRFVPVDVHVWEKFIRPDELAASLQRHGLVHAGFTGLSPAINPLRALIALVHQKFGRRSYAELGQHLRLKASTDCSVSYMGFAVRSLRS